MAPCTKCPKVALLGDFTVSGVSLLLIWWLCVIPVASCNFRCPPAVHRMTVFHFVPMLLSQWLSIVQDVPLKFTKVALCCLLFLSTVISAVSWGHVNCSISIYWGRFAWSLVSHICSIGSCTLSQLCICCLLEWPSLVFLHHCSLRWVWIISGVPFGDLRWLGVILCVHSKLVAVVLKFRTCPTAAHWNGLALSQVSHCLSL